MDRIPQGSVGLPHNSGSSPVSEFINVYRQYRKAHPPLYALRMAWGIAVLRLPF